MWTTPTIHAQATHPNFQGRNEPLTFHRHTSDTVADYSSRLQTAFRGTLHPVDKLTSGQQTHFFVRKLGNATLITFSFYPSCPSTCQSISVVPWRCEPWRKRQYMTEEWNGRSLCPDVCRYWGLDQGRFAFVTWYITRNWPLCSISHNVLAWRSRSKNIIKIQGCHTLSFALYGCKTWVCHVNGRTKANGVREWGDEEDVWS